MRCVAGRRSVGVVPPTRSWPPGQLPPDVARGPRVPRCPAGPSVSLAADVRRGRPLPGRCLSVRGTARRLVGDLVVAAPPDAPPAGPSATPDGAGPLHWPRRRSTSVRAFGGRRGTATASAAAPWAARSPSRLPTRLRSVRRAPPDRAGSPRCPRHAPASVRAFRGRRDAAVASAAAPRPAASRAHGQRFVRRRGFRSVPARPDGSPRTPRGFSSARGARPRPSALSGRGVRLGRCSSARGVARSGGDSSTAAASGARPRALT